MRRSEARRKQDCCLLGGDGFLQAAGFHQRGAVIALRRSILRFAAGEFLEVGDGLLLLGWRHKMVKNTTAPPSPVRKPSWIPWS